MEEYVSVFHKEEIVNALKSGSAIITLNFDLSNLSSENEKLFNQLKYYFDDEYAKWKKAAINLIAKVVQEENIHLPNRRMDIEFDFFNHPKRIEWPQLTVDMFQLIEFKGYVFRSSTPKKLEMLREVKCIKCKQTTMIKADRQFDYAFKCSNKCIIKDECEGKMVYTKTEEEIPPMENTIDFQTFKVQELDKFTPRNRYYSIEVEGKLVDSCSIGDTVYILGVFETRNDLYTKEIKRVVIRGLNITKAFEFKHSINSSEKEVTFNAWIAEKRRHNNNELEARDELLKAVAPELKNCFILKLVLLIVLCTGGRSKQKETRSQRLERMTNRDTSHLLFIGLPGLGKSQLLKAASKISSRAIKCVGSGCTIAGLTASSYKEDKETHVEAGALVLANHGICCIDEFNLLSLRCRDALHDVMEHQKFSFMQANLKVEVNTRCSVIASMNHKAEQQADARNKNIKNSVLNIEPSLLSRFDFVYFLEKPEDPQFDKDIVDAIIGESLTEPQPAATDWTIDKLQMHIIGAKNINCELTPDVMKLLLNYYRFTNACEGVDESRKTMRLLKGLERLTIGHAKLMLRHKTKLIDAVTIIWLTENSWTFGDLIDPTNLILSDLPVGPSLKCIKYIFDTLRLSELYEVFEKEQEEIFDDGNAVMRFNSTIREEVTGPKELKKLFNKTSCMKRKSNERGRDENKTHVDGELSEELRRSFAINSILDIFEDSNDEPGSSNKQNVESSDALSIRGMEDYFVNQMSDELDESINVFNLPNENTSTQRDVSVPTQDRDSNAKKPSLFNLLAQKQGGNQNSSKVRKLSNDDEDLFKIFSDDPMGDQHNIQSSKAETSSNSSKKNSGQTEKSSKSSGFLERLKNFKYTSQESEKSQDNSCGEKNPGSSSCISENLLSLSNQLAKNHSNKIENPIPSMMSREEYLKALDDEMDIWN